MTCSTLANGGQPSGEAQLEQAEENVSRLKEEVAVGIEHRYNKLESGSGSKRSRKTAAGGRALGTESVGRGSGIGVRTEPGFCRQLQSTDRLAPGQLRVPAGLGRTRTSYGTNPRTLTIQASAGYGCPSAYQITKSVIGGVALSCRILAAF